MRWVMVRARVFAVVALLLGFVLLPVGAARAHVELASSNPADGATLADSPAAIELSFTTGVALAGDGVVLLDDAGDAQTVDVHQPADDLLVISPATRLSEGAYAVIWTVRSGDAHPRSGAVGFVVDASTAVSPPAAGERSGPRVEPFVAEAEPPTASEPSTPIPAGPAQRAIPIAAATVEVDELPGEGVARLGRWLSLLGALVGIGVIAFAATTLVGSRREIAEAGFWIRRSGVAIVGGTVIEVAGTSAMLSGSWWSGMLPSSVLAAVIGPFGVAVVLRVAGGIALLQGTAIVPRPASDPPASGDSIFSLMAAKTSSGGIATATHAETRHRMDLAGSVVAIAGGAAVALSHLFDGHTVTTTPAVVVRLAAVTHVVGAAVWVGGVLMLGRMLAWRRRRGVPLRAAELAIRFSRVAAVALGAVAIAGLALTWAILDEPGSLFTTQWGRFLLFKLALVGVAVGLGGYNHRYVVPLLDGDGDDEAIGNRLRMTVRVEGAILIGVVAVTAALVGAAS